jgi:hypothetical protein
MWLFALSAALACASSGTQNGSRGTPAPQPAAAPAPATAPAPAQPASGPARPTTAAEAAEQAHEEWVRSHGSGGDAPGAAAQKGARADDAPCASDADCTLTRVAPGTCCATLCSPRAITAARGAEIDRAGAECRGCVEPLCRDPGRVEAACRAGRCVTRASASPD